jgi:hypothetical protein
VTIFVDLFTLYFKEHVMSCQSFANLLAAYKTRAHPLHDQASLPRYEPYSDGALGSEQERPRRKNSQFMSTVGCKTCDELVNACKRSARDHMNFVLASKKDAAQLALERKKTTDALLAHLRQDHADLVGKAGSSGRLPL